jgi:hypothetical protein
LKGNDIGCNPAEYGKGFRPLSKKNVTERTRTNNADSSGFQTVGCETQLEAWFIPRALLIETD